jgi:hypothetical protein
VPAGICVEGSLPSRKRYEKFGCHHYLLRRIEREGRECIRFGFSAVFG